MSLPETHAGSFQVTTSAQKKNVGRTGESNVSTNSEVRLILESDSDDKVSSNGVDVTDVSEAESQLRNDFTKLLGILIGDDNLLLELGWKKRPIDCVLEDVMRRTGMDPVLKSTSGKDLDRLRENVKLMLAASLEDSVQETVGLGQEPIDKVVKEMLALSQDD